MEEGAPVTAHDLAGALPAITELRERCQAFVALDAMLSPEWEWRYYSFDAHWAPGEQMASMRDGSGDAWSIVFAFARAGLGRGHGVRPWRVIGALSIIGAAVTNPVRWWSRPHSLSGSAPLSMAWLAPSPLGAVRFEGSP
jgi:hypothetical protein